RASTTLEWVAENRLQATGRIIGNEVAITNVRNFDWIDKRTFEEKWEARQYDIETLQAIDVFVSSWGNPRIAHIMVSFDFAGGPPLCVSVETRREAGERWSALAGFMKSYELIIIAGDERDLVRSRVNVRGEDVRLYRIYTTPEMRRKILAGTIAQMNRLSARPRFYNTIFHNCTIEIARIVWAAGHRFPFDWRLLVSGYVAEYLYDVGLLDRTLPFAGLKTSADITQRSRTADRAPDYSQRIRAGLRDPTRDIAVTASPVSPARPQVGARP
ncbi:MAG TPA: DUF4105 domain-containing protein, partial [Hyphomicrobiaceae bacterium]|nr:DUF4105 domain-containing protein [Hyphomicrobiaceae bacterium]